MRLLRYQEDRLPVGLIVGWFALDVAVFFCVRSTWLLLLWFGIGIIPKGCIAAWNHHHQHLMTFRLPVLNRLLEIVYGFHTGITSNVWVLHHVVGHHVHYLDQSKDKSRWKRGDGRRMGRIEYDIQVTLTAYPRAIASGLRHRQYLGVLFGMMAVTATLLGLAAWYNLTNALLVFLLPMVTAMFLTSDGTYEHHSGFDTDNPNAATMNILSPLYNRVTGNLGYHTAHHLRPGVHWSRLPELHGTLAGQIPQQCYREPGFPWSWLSHLATLGASRSGVRALPPAP